MTQDHSTHLNQARRQQVMPDDNSSEGTVEITDNQPSDWYDRGSDQNDATEWYSDQSDSINDWHDASYDSTW